MQIVEEIRRENAGGNDYANWTLLDVSVFLAEEAIRVDGLEQQVEQQDQTIQQLRAEVDRLNQQNAVLKLALDMKNCVQCKQQATQYTVTSECKTCRYSKNRFNLVT